VEPFGFKIVVKERISMKTFPYCGSNLEKMEHGIFIVIFEV